MVSDKLLRKIFKNTLGKSEFTAYYESLYPELPITAGVKFLSEAVWPVSKCTSEVLWYISVVMGRKEIFHKINIYISSALFDNIFKLIQLTLHVCCLGLDFKIFQNFDADGSVALSLLNHLEYTIEFGHAVVFFV